MTEDWIVYDVASGVDRWRGSGPVGSAAQQQVDEGLAIVAVPHAVITGAEINLPLLRLAVAAQVDAQAEQVRQRYLTPGAGQAMTYQRKEAEARAWTVDNRTTTPFLSAEAPARGMTIAALAAEVIQLADAWVMVGAAIEAQRMGAKGAVEAAATLGAIVAAGRVDWIALDATAA